MVLGVNEGSSKPGPHTGSNYEMFSSRTEFMNIMTKPEASVEICDEVNSVNEQADKVRTSLQSAYDVVAQAKNKVGRHLSNIFMDLPAPASYPDYYEVIKQPLCMTDVQKKLSCVSVPITVDGFVKDMLLIFENARTYNREYSMIYNDSLTLENMFRKEMKRQFPDFRLPSPTYRHKYKKPDEMDSDEEEEEEERRYQQVLKDYVDLAASERQLILDHFATQERRKATTEFFGRRRSLSEVRAKKVFKDFVSQPLVIYYGVDEDFVPEDMEAEADCKLLLGDVQGEEGEGEGEGEHDENHCLLCSTEPVIVGARGKGKGSVKKSPPMKVEPVVPVASASVSGGAATGSDSRVAVPGVVMLPERVELFDAEKTKKFRKRFKAGLLTYAPVDIYRVGASTPRAAGSNGAAAAAAASSSSSAPPTKRRRTASASVAAAAGSGDGGTRATLGRPPSVKKMVKRRPGGRSRMEPRWAELQGKLVRVMPSGNNPRQVPQDGLIRGGRIECLCCNELFAASGFAVHGGNLSHRPFHTIRLQDDGTALADWAQPSQPGSTTTRMPSMDLPDIPSPKRSPSPVPSSIVASVSGAIDTSPTVSCDELMQSDMVCSPLVMQYDGTGAPLLSSLPGLSLSQPALGMSSPSLSISSSTTPLQFTAIPTPLGAPLSPLHSSSAVDPLLLSAVCAVTATPPPAPRSAVPFQLPPADTIFGSSRESAAAAATTAARSFLAHRAVNGGSSSSSSSVSHSSSSISSAAAAAVPMTASLQSRAGTGAVATTAPPATAVAAGGKMPLPTPSPTSVQGFTPHSAVPGWSPPTVGQAINSNTVVTSTAVGSVGTAGMTTTGSGAKGAMSMSMPMVSIATGARTSLAAAAASVTPGGGGGVGGAVTTLQMYSNGTTSTSVSGASQPAQSGYLMKSTTSTASTAGTAASRTMGMTTTTTPSVVSGQLAPGQRLACCVAGTCTAAAAAAAAAAAVASGVAPGSVAGGKPSSVPLSTAYGQPHYGYRFVPRPGVPYTAYVPTSSGVQGVVVSTQGTQMVSGMPGTGQTAQGQLGVAQRQQQVQMQAQAAANSQATGSGLVSSATSGVVTAPVVGGGPQKQRVSGFPVGVSGKMQVTAYAPPTTGGPMGSSSPTSSIPVSFMPVSGQSSSASATPATATAAPTSSSGVATTGGHPTSGYPVSLTLPSSSGASGSYSVSMRQMQMAPTPSSTGTNPQGTVGLPTSTAGSTPNMVSAPSSAVPSSSSSGLAAASATQCATMARSSYVVSAAPTGSTPVSYASVPVQVQVSAAHAHAGMRRMVPLPQYMQRAWSHVPIRPWQAPIRPAAPTSSGPSASASTSLPTSGMIATAGVMAASSSGVSRGVLSITPVRGPSVPGQSVSAAAPISKPTLSSSVPAVATAGVAALQRGTPSPVVSPTAQHSISGSREVDTSIDWSAPQQVQGLVGRRVEAKCDDNGPNAPSSSTHWATGLLLADGTGFTIRFDGGQTKSGVRLPSKEVRVLRDDGEGHRETGPEHDSPLTNSSGSLSALPSLDESSGDGDETMEDVDVDPADDTHTGDRRGSSSGSWRGGGRAASGPAPTLSKSGRRAASAAAAAAAAHEQSLRRISPRKGKGVRTTGLEDFETSVVTAAMMGEGGDIDDLKALISEGGDGEAGWWNSELFTGDDVLVGVEEAQEACVAAGRRNKNGKRGRRG